MGGGGGGGGGGMYNRLFCLNVAYDTRLVLEIDSVSVVGMDNFGGMNNNMDRFGSSGVGRMNGGFPDALVIGKRGTLGCLAG